MKKNKQNSLWKKCTIGDLCKVGDGAHGSLKREDSGILYLTSKNLKNGNLDLSKVDFISEDTYARYFRKNSKALTQPQPNDVLFNIIGTIGSPYLVRSEDRFGISSSVAILRSNQSEIFPKYLFYWIFCDFFQNALYGIKGGVAQGYINLEMIRSLPLHYPPLPTQRKIAGILSAYDDLIENNTRRIAILEEMAQLIYREWFVHFRYPGYESVPLVESELGPIPEGWKVVKIGDQFKVVLGGTPSRKKQEYWDEGNIPWINSSKANELRIVSPSEMITNEGLKKSSTKLMPKRTTVLAITGATLGQVSLLEIEACANQSIVGIIDEEKTYSEFIYLFVSTDINSIINKASGGAQQHINKQIVEETPIFLPTRNILIKFNHFIEPVFNLIT